MNFIGIDPGKGGAMAVIRSDGSIVTSVFSEEAYKGMVDALAANAGSAACSTFAVVEKVHAMPKQGVTSMFSFGRNLGWIEGLLYAKNIPYQLVPPQTWKKCFGILFPGGTDKKVIKSASVNTAHHLFPGVSLKATERCKVDHDGISEAILMAEYARRIHK